MSCDERQTYEHTYLPPRLGMALVVPEHQKLGNFFSSCFCGNLGHVHRTIGPPKERGRRRGRPPTDQLQFATFLSLASENERKSPLTETPTPPISGGERNIQCLLRHPSISLIVKRSVNIIFPTLFLHLTPAEEEREGGGGHFCERRQQTL